MTVKAGLTVQYKDILQLTAFIIKAIFCLCTAVTDFFFLLNVYVHSVFSVRFCLFLSFNLAYHLTDYYQI